MSTLPDWIPADAWAGYIEMRKKIKKVMTPRAEAMQIKTLEEFRDAGYDVAEILDNSTMNNWTSLYQPKEKAVAAKGKLPQLGKQGQATADNANQWLNDHAMDDTLDQKRRFASLITGMADYYKAEISRTALSIYWEGLRQFSYEAIEKACWAHTQLADEAGRWMPRNSDIVKMIEGGTADRAMMAWSKVDNAVRVRGTWDDVVFDDEIIHRVIADMGGWVLVGGKDDKEWPFVGKEFQQRYRAFSQRGGAAEYPAKLTGIANAQNGSSGRPELPPILIGDTEKAKQVLKKGSGAAQLGFQRAQIGHATNLKETAMTYLKFDVKVTTHVTREPDPDDRWDNGCSDGTVEILSCHLADQDVYDGLTASFDVLAGDTVWLVWAQYSTGDSFGSYGGSYELCSVFESQEKAEAEVKRLKDVTDYSVPWNGHFENLDEIQAQPMKVLP